MNDGLIIDLFAGGGGASTGIEWALGRPVDYAVNHDRQALDMHARNHPGTVHFCEDVFKVSPRAVCGAPAAPGSVFPPSPRLRRASRVSCSVNSNQQKGTERTERGALRPVLALWASPDCTHFSKAKGGKPRCRKRRGLAGVILKWADQVRPAWIGMENVEEFITWGPLDRAGQPVKAKAGGSFRRWVSRLKNLGYAVEWREMVGADYGAPTTRKRLFIIARCDGRAIVWPERTHQKIEPQRREGRKETSMQEDLFCGGVLPWRGAWECIDWGLACPSIFERKRPLAENTLKRIAAGLRKFVIEAVDPFIVPMTHGGGPERVYPIDKPMKTVTGAHRWELALCVQQIEKIEPQRREERKEEDAQPRATVPHEDVSAPFVAKHYGGVVGHGLERPLGAVTAIDHHSLVVPSLVGVGGRAGQSAPRGADEPMGTVTSKGDRALIAPVLVGVGGPSYAGKPKDAAEPFGTVLTESHQGLASAFLSKFYGTNVGSDARLPLPTITGGGQHIAEVRAFLVSYYGTGTGQSVRQPARTITTKDRLGLVTVAGVEYQIVDIGLRMLAPRELARAQGFPEDYWLPSNKSAAVRMIGNSVCPAVAEAIVRANLPEHCAAARAA